jgi:hypothetical protein
VASAFARQNGISLASGSIFFLFGPPEHPNGLAPSVIRALLAGEVANCSHGNQRRARGFQTLEDDNEVLYQVFEFHAPESARGIRWDDPLFAISWRIRSDVIISKKDVGYSLYAFH